MMWQKLKKILGFDAEPMHKFVASYESYQTTFKNVDPKSLISEKSFVILDTETTGLNLAMDHVLSIGAVKVINASINLADSLSLRILSHQLHKPESIIIHGLVQTDKNGITEQEAIDQFLNFIGHDILVGHHIAFDIAMLNKLLKNNGGGILINKTLDTSFLARRLDHSTNPNELDRKNYTLDKLCERFKVIPKGRHTAEGDAYITAIIFIKIIHLLSVKGIKTIGHLLK